MLKIGIITYHFVPNYGAAMQAWALQEYLMGEGYDVKIIDYRPSHLIFGGNLFIPRNILGVKMNCIKLLLKVCAFRSLFSKKERIKNQKFAKFHKDFFRLTKQRLHNHKELNNLDEKFDVYICGSDQIWNASNHSGIDDAYFLGFLSNLDKKVSYAASFGRASIEDSYKCRIARLLKSFNFISVRELSGTHIVKELTNYDVEYVLDPTLLFHGDYPEPHESADSKGSFIFSYALRARKLVASTNDYISKKLNLEIISDKPHNIKEVALSPFEWVSHIRHARFVVTNSYHGTLFSIIFRKAFIYVALSGKKAGYNDRAINLLKDVGLTELIIYEYDEEKINQILDNTINWEKVGSKINVKRSFSQAYLKRALN
jgi:hypothetical protein